MVEYITIAGHRIRKDIAYELYQLLKKSKEENHPLKRLIQYRNKQLLQKAKELGIDPPKISEFFFKPEIFWAKVVKFRHLNNQKLELVIDGESGAGKSFLGADITYTFYKLFYGDKLAYDLFKKSFITPAPLQIVEDRAELEWIRVQLNDIMLEEDWELDESPNKEQPKVEIVTVDEAVETLNAKESMSRGYLKVVKMIRKARKYKKSFIFAIPSILELGKDVRARSLNAWIHLYTRIKNQFSIGFVLGGNPHRELEFDYDHIKDALDLYGPDGWKRNRYYWGTILHYYKPDIYELYKKVFIEKAEEIRKILIDEGIIDVVTRTESEREAMRTAFLSFVILAMLQNEMEIALPFLKIVSEEGEVDYTSTQKLKLYALRIAIHIRPSRLLMEIFEKVWKMFKSAVYREGKNYYLDYPSVKQMYYATFHEDPEQVVEELAKKIASGT